VRGKITGGAHVTGTPPQLSNQGNLISGSMLEAVGAFKVNLLFGKEFNARRSGKGAQE
jgi:hypothetical protein